MAFPKSRILTTKRFIQLFHETKDKQRFCFILGSGASVESGIPSGGILEMDWMDCLMGKRSDRGTAPMDPEESESIAGALLDGGYIGHSFSEIKANWEEAKSKGWRSMSSEFYFDLFKLRFHPLQQNGYRYLESLMKKVEPSPGYRALALLLTEGHQHNLVITTNFDNLVEDALFLHTEWRPLVISHEALAEYIRFNTNRPIIVKDHRGLMYDPSNSPLNTNKLKEEWSKILECALNAYTPIVVGYGGGDRNLMSALQKAEFRNGIYWCFRKASGLPDPKILDFLEKQEGYLVETEGFDALMIELGQELFGFKIPFKEAPLASDSLNKANKEMQMDMQVANPSKTVFLSYSWDNTAHKNWVRNLYNQLKSNGFNVILDQIDLVLGDPIPQFMEQAIIKSDYTLIICTPKYKEKADARKGGVGYEESIIASDVFLTQNQRKYIPVLASGSWDTSCPIWATGKLGADLSDESFFQEEFTKLINTMNR